MPTDFWPYAVGFAAAVGVAGGVRLLLYWLRAGRTAPPSEADGSLSMRVIGGYRLVEVLARGGMGVVYLAVPESTLDPAQALACKVVAREHCQDPEFRLRFLREIAICQRLEHPGIVKLHTSGEEQGRVFLMLELMQGETLRERMAAAGHDLAPYMPTLEIVFGAVAHAHERGVVHRDLKPENVMIARDGRVKVMDFGLARWRMGTRITGTGGAVGTPAYMAPEQLRGAAADPAQDQYALGVVLFEILTGTLPFQERNVAQLIFQKLGGTAPPASRRRPGVHPAVEGVVARMLARKPEVRFESVEEAWAALERAVAAQREAERADDPLAEPP